MSRATKMLKEGSSFIAHVTTISRDSGQPHTVPLRLVYHRGRLYASRLDERSDWYRNVLQNPSMVLDIDGERFSAAGRLVTDEALCQKISQLKYGDERGLQKRRVIEMVVGDYL